MIVTPFDPVPSYPERLQSQADSDGLVRSPGLHLSTIIRAIEQTIRPKDEWCTQEELEFFGAGGFMWERVFAMAHADAFASGEVIRPGEFELDGIAGSPDFIRTSDWTLIETKCTWRGLRKWESLEKNFWSWLVQTRGYCKLIGSNVCEIHCFFVAGDWRPPLPTVRSIRIEYTDRELEENWFMITNFARQKGWID